MDSIGLAGCREVELPAQEQARCDGIEPVRQTLRPGTLVELRTTAAPARTTSLSAPLRHPIRLAPFLSDSVAGSARLGALSRILHFAEAACRDGAGWLNLLPQSIARKDGDRSRAL